MSLLHAAKSPVRARTGAALLIALLAGPALPAAGQDTTVIGSGGSDSGVTVNMGVLDQGAAPSRTPSTGGRASGRIQLRQPDGGGEQASQQRGDAEAGEPGPGPLGRVLRFPPMDQPKSRLTVDPEALASQQERRGEQQQAARPQLKKPEPRSDSGTTAADRTTGGQTQDSGRASRLTPQGREMARQDGGAQPSDGPAQQAPRTGSSSAPDTPELPEAPSAPESGAPESGASGTGTPESGATDNGGTQTASGGSALDTPDPAKPASKPSPSERDTGDAAQTASSGDAAGTTGMAAAEPEAETARTGSGADEGDSQTQTQTATTGSMQAGDSADTTTGTGSASGDRGGSGDGAGSGDASAASGDTASDTGETQTAKRTPGESAMPGKLQLDFASGSAELSDAVRDKLNSLADRLSENPNQRIQLMAFAKGGDEGASRARRLSLSRALAVRSFLIDKGIRSTRMDVRALGDTAKEGPLDRVDIQPANS